jgi:RNA methyltransferase, TrmH family
LITSHHNPVLQEVRRLNARRSGSRPPRFVAEGEDLLAAADAAGWEPVVRLRAGEDVTAEALAKVSSLGSGTRELAVYEERWGVPQGPLCVALWGVRDPGNVGTVLRAALAFGAASVAFGPGTADPYGPKAVRASMGAVFAVPVARVARVSDLPHPTVALVAREGGPLSRADAGTLVVGAEREGLPGEVVAGCDRVRHIPIRSESLNAAMAATIALYAVAGHGPATERSPGDA